MSKEGGVGVVLAPPLAGALGVVPHRLGLKEMWDNGMMPSRRGKIAES